jgi:hypothetical protein
MQLDDFAGIIPLGNMNPPEHTLPTDHIYFMYERAADPSQTLEVDVFAPGDVLIYGVSDLIGVRDGVQNHDYALRFSPCKDLEGRYGHLSSLSSGLLSAFEASRQECSAYGDVERAVSYRSCEATLQYAMKTGERVGTGGGKMSGALDLFLYDHRVTPPVVAAPARFHATSLQAVCPINYYTGSLRASLEMRLGSFDVPRTVTPRCGSVFQDVPGTLAGAWFSAELPPDVALEPQAWNRTVSFAVDATDGVTAVASLGGPMTPDRLVFAPRHEGSVNRAFQEVTPGPDVWCYQPDAPGASQHLLVGMPESTRMRAQIAIGTCAQGEAFTAPIEYRR